MRRVAGHLMHQIAFEEFEVIILGQDADLDEPVVLRHAEAAEPRHDALVRKVSSLGRHEFIRLKGIAFSLTAIRLSRDSANFASISGGLPHAIRSSICRWTAITSSLCSSMQLAAARTSSSDTGSAPAICSGVHPFSR